MGKAVVCRRTDLPNVFTVTGCLTKIADRHAHGESQLLWYPQEDCGQRFTGKCKLFCLGWQLLFSDRPALWVDELVAQCQLCPAGPAAGCSFIDLYSIFIRSFCFGCGLATICLSASQVIENLRKNGSFIAKLLNWQFIARKQCEKLLATPRPHAHIALLNERTVYLARLKRTQTLCYDTVIDTWY